MDLRSWQTVGEMVVVLADFNEDVTSQDLNQFFHEFDLVEVVTALHNRMLHQHTTMGANRSMAYDIFIPTHFLPHCWGGYLEFGQGVPSDHQVLWIDLPANLVCS